MDQTFFILAVLTVLAAPGPTNTLFAASGASVGLYRSLRLPFAGVAGYLLAISLLDSLVGPVLALHPLALPALKLLASLWLFTCATKLWRDSGSEFFGTATAISFRQVFLTTLLNPKSLIFAFAIFPQTPIPGLLPWFAAFCGLVFLVALGWIGTGVLIARTAGPLASPSRIKRITALGLAAFATVFACSAVAVGQ